MGAGATLRGEATIEGTNTTLVFNANAIDHIEAAADRSIIDMMDELRKAAEEEKKPRLSTLATLLWGSFLHARPDMTRDEAYAIAISGEAAPLNAMALALRDAFPSKEDGEAAGENPPNRQARRAQESKAKKSGTGS